MPRQSWISPSAKDTQYLLYISDLTHGVVDIYAERSADAALVGQLAISGGDPGGGVCIDHRGNVYVVYENFSGDGGEIDEYAHGSSTIKESLNLTGFLETCAVDRTTGNIAVAILSKGYDKVGGIYLISGGLKKGHYVFLTDRGGLQAMWDDVYDSSGNLFIRGKKVSIDGLDELPVGSTKLVHLMGLKLDDQSTVGWDGHYVTVGDDAVPYYSFTVDEITVAGSAITVVRSATFTDSACSYGLTMPKALVRSTTRLVSVNASCPNRVGFWDYASGGEPKRSWSNVDLIAPRGEAISATRM
jgi:hypothetical protein